MGYPHPPARPSGTNSEATFMQQVWDLFWDPKTNIFCQSDSSGIQFDKTTKGYSAKVRANGGGSTMGPSLFVHVSDAGDWYNCYPITGIKWNGGGFVPIGAGTQTVKVAKDQELCCLLPTGSPNGAAFPSQQKRDALYTYVYNKVLNTTADSVGVWEYTRDVYISGVLQGTSYVMPYLYPGMIITADPITFTGPPSLVGIKWIAQNRGRTWADPNPDDS